MQVDDPARTFDLHVVLPLQTYGSKWTTQWFPVNMQKKRPEIVRISTDWDVQCRSNLENKRERKAQLESKWRGSKIQKQIGQNQGNKGMLRKKGRGQQKAQEKCPLWNPNLPHQIAQEWIFIFISYSWLQPTVCIVCGLKYFIALWMQ